MPGDFERRFLERDHARIAFLAGGAGPAVILIHGGGSRGSHFLPLMERLADRYSVYAPDLRGYGDTGCQPGQRLSHQVWAEDILALIDEIGADSVFLVGWSLGATVALNVASQAGGRVKAITLMGAPDPNKPINPDFIRERLALFRSGLSPEAVVEQILVQSSAMLGRSALSLNPGALDVIRAEQLAAAPCVEQVAGAIIDRPPFLPILERVDCPVTLMVGDEDIMCDLATARRLQAKIPSSRLVTILQCGHYYTLEQPDAVADVIKGAFR